jgi:3-methylcrotonyl-CoA carboxylase beta subunit
MGGEQAAQVLATVRREKSTDEERKKFMDEIRGHYERQGHPYYATARLWDDGVIDPLDTRRVLGLALHAAARGPEPEPERYGIFRM